MPQTREHTAILRWLGIANGVVAITKIDMIEPDWLEMVIEETSSVLGENGYSGVPVISVDSLSGRGLPELKEELARLANRVKQRSTDAPALLSIDRVFSKPGFGPVITGTVASGKFRVGDEIVILPQNKKVRIRGIQSHNEKQTVVGAGERAAINLTGIVKEEIVRGNRLCQPGVFGTTDRFDVRLQVNNGVTLKHRSRIRLHIGTAELIGRIDLLENSLLESISGPVYARFISEEPAVVGHGEKFVIRTYSPQETIGGGEILHPSPRIRLREPMYRILLSGLHSHNRSMKVEAAVRSFEPYAATASDVVTVLSQSTEATSQLIDQAVASEYLISANGSLIGKSFFESELKAIVSTVSTFHSTNAERMGISPAVLLQPYTERIGEALTNRLLTTGIERGLLIDNDRYIKTSRSSTPHECERIESTGSSHFDASSSGFNAFVSSSIGIRARHCGKRVVSFFRPPPRTWHGCRVGRTVLVYEREHPSSDGFDS